MAGLIPDSSAAEVGNMNDAGGARIEPPSGVDHAAPTQSAQVIHISGDKITISGASDADPAAPLTNTAFDDNLAEFLGSDALSEISIDLLQGIDDDIESRREFIENYTKGLDYLGLKMQNQTATRGRRTTAKVYHPAMQWAIVKFQSGVRGELLPAGGPVKASLDGTDTGQLEAVARDLEADMNHYLTVAASEFYPDQDRGHFYLGYGGNLYKKIYRCPIRQRPVSECVYIGDLIVSNEATDLANAQRVTHKIEMMSRDVRQLMALGIYREVELTVPTQSEDRIKRKEREIAGKRTSQSRPEDTPHTIYEAYTFLDLSKYDMGEKDQPEANRFNDRGMSDSDRVPIPYRVTIDRDSKQILEIRRNWREHDVRFLRRRVFVKYGLVPGMGFLDYGYLHLIGNTVQALTALLRLTIDAGMFSNFPGGIRIRAGRTGTNEINPGPGEFAEMDVMGDDIRKNIMPMPYKEPSQTIFALMQYLEGQIKTIAGAVEFDVGEGRTNIPVGTMMAMVEQQTQVMAAVHKRLHTAQKEELIAIKDLFVEYPEDLELHAGVSGRKWSQTGELRDIHITPRSDPNIPAQTHRLMQSTALAMLAQQAPQLYNLVNVNKRLLQNIGISDPDSLLNPQQAQAPDPKAMAEQGKLSLQQQEQQANAAQQQQENQLRLQELAIESQDRAADRASREKVAASKVQIEAMKVQAAAQNTNGGNGPGTAGGGPNV